MKKIMNKEEIKNALYHAAKKNYDYIVVEDYYCDEPKVYGSNVSYSVLNASGGKYLIMQHRYEDGKLYFEINHMLYDLEAATNFIDDYYNN